MSAHRGGASINIDEHIEEHAEVSQLVFKKMSWMQRMMMDMREDPEARTAKLKEHLAAVQERSQMQKVVHELPVRDLENETSKAYHHTSYKRDKSMVRYEQAPVFLRPSLCHTCHPSGNACGTPRAAAPARSGAPGATRLCLTTSCRPAPHGQIESGLAPRLGTWAWHLKQYEGA